MNIRINAVHFKASDSLEDFLKERISKLALFQDKLQSAEVFLRLENVQNKENKIVEIKLIVPGEEFFAEKQSESFEKSADLAVEALRRQLKKHKGKTTEIS
jgi:putative sigma-54 modulation protein